MEPPVDPALGCQETRRTPGRTVTGGLIPALPTLRRAAGGDVHMGDDPAGPAALRGI